MIGYNITKLSDAQFKKFSDLVYSKTGIFLKPEKKELLNARLGKRLRACRIDNFKDYYQYVMQDRSGEELIQLIDSVSTNFTSFFREKGHFDYLGSTVLPEIVHDRKRNNELIVWSAACSSGEEPYTLAMVLDDYFSSYPDQRFVIQATDISTKVLAQAERGIYSEDRITGIPNSMVRKYFQKGVGQSAGYVKIKEVLRRVVKFSRFNLMDEFSWPKPVDIIFCRNVMIYFNRETQQDLVSKFYSAMAPGGYLFIGHSESITSIKHGFKQIASTTYRK
ncbi:CheR family methyltransferase [Thermodesulfobacteriota bacterium]